LSLFLRLENVRELEFPAQANFTFFVENGKSNIHEKEQTSVFHFKSQAWGYGQFISHDKLETKFIDSDGQIALGARMIEDKIKLSSSIVSITQKLYDNSKDGDVQVKCKDGKVVCADKFFLILDSFLAAIFGFKDNLIHVEDEKTPTCSTDIIADACTVDLSNFSSPAVYGLIAL
jgi:MATH domain